MTGVAGTTKARPLCIHVEHCMGTVFTIDIRDDGDCSTAVAEVCRWLHHVDAVFSTYRPDSDINRMNRGEVDIRDAHPEVATVLDLCAQVQHQTGGYFAATIGGRLDPTGLVKGWAIERASELLRAHGSDNHAVNGGGDMQLAGEPEPGEPWRIGISDPHDTRRIITVAAGRDFAVATSGISERGHHIANPFTGAPATGLAAATVVGRSLTTVDAFATAAFVMGTSAPAWLECCPGIEGLIVDEDGAVRHTTGFHSGWLGARGGDVSKEAP